MKKIGLIDLFIDEWHANNYPAWIRASKLAGDFTLWGAWEEQAKPEGRDLAAWCRDFDLRPYKSQEELIADCDCFFVLAPSNPEVHERLAEAVLASGKPVYIDKPFAPDLAAAKRLFARADRYGTPMWSSSALRFGEELVAAQQKLAGEKIGFMAVRGGGRSFEEYSIHLAEQIVATMGTNARRVMQCGCGAANHAVVEFDDGRRAAMTHCYSMPYIGEIVYGEGKVEVIPGCKEMFPHLLDAVLTFFRTGESPVPREQTLAVAALTAAAIRGLAAPDTWVEVER